MWAGATGCHACHHPATVFKGWVLTQVAWRRSPCGDLQAHTGDRAKQSAHQPWPDRGFSLSPNGMLEPLFSNRKVTSRACTSTLRPCTNTDLTRSQLSQDELGRNRNRTVPAGKTNGGNDSLGGLANLLLPGPPYPGGQAPSFGKQTMNLYMQAIDFTRSQKVPGPGHLALSALYPVWRSAAEKGQQDRFLQGSS